MIVARYFTLCFGKLCHHSNFALQAVYKTNQKSSDLERWQKIPPRSDMAVAYKVEKYIFR